MKVKVSNPAALLVARAAIKDGKVICLPTDTVYGIGADPFNADAVTRLLTAKSRTREFPSPVLVADIEQAASLVSDLPPLARTLMAQFWPGALTLVLPARQLGWDLGETNGTVALRMPNSEFTLELLKKVGPLAVTSANKHGEPPATEIDHARRQLGRAVSLYLDAGKIPGTNIASTIYDVVNGKILREGAISSAELAGALS